MTTARDDSRSVTRVGASLLVFAWIIRISETRAANNSSGLCSLLASVPGKAQLSLIAFSARVDFFHSRNCELDH